MYGIAVWCNELARRFETINEAARQLDLRPGNISKVLHGQAKRTCGFTFRYIE